jgi:hypothetical protein
MSALGSAVRNALRAIDPGYKSASSKKRTSAIALSPNFRSIGHVWERIKEREESAKKKRMVGGTRRKKRFRGTRRRNV